LAAGTKKKAIQKEVRPESETAAISKERAKGNIAKNCYKKKKKSEISCSGCANSRKGSNIHKKPFTTAPVAQGGLNFYQKYGKENIKRGRIAKKTGQGNGFVAVTIGGGVGRKGKQRGKKVGALEGK